MLLCFLRLLCHVRNADTLDGTHNNELEEPKGFVNLLQPRYLAPAGVAAALLGAEFVVVSSPAEEQLLHQQLRCEYMSQADFSAQFLVARWAACACMH